MEVLIFKKQIIDAAPCSVTDPHKRRLILSLSLLSRFPFSKDHKELLLKVVPQDFE